MSPPLGTIDERKSDIAAVPSNYARLFQEATAWLAKEKLVHVMVTEYRLGHQMLSFWIFNHEEEAGFYLVCENCYSIEYEPYIQTSTLKIERIDGLASPYKSANAAFQVSDAQGQIRVVCCALAITWCPTPWV